VDPLFTGDACDVCADPTKAGSQCELCKDMNMTGEDCDVPVEPNPVDALRICLDYRSCVVTSCAQAPPEEMAACAAEALAACGEPKEEAEWEIATELVACMVDECDSLGETSANYECWRQKCMPEHVACAARQFGDIDCEFLGACMVDCGDAVADTDWSCFRECIETGSEPGVERYIDLDFCVRAECFEAENWALCKQEVLFNTPLCHIPMVACFMDK